MTYARFAGMIAHDIVFIRRVSITQYINAYTYYYIGRTIRTYMIWRTSCTLQRRVIIWDMTVPVKYTLKTLVRLWVYNTHKRTGRFRRVNCSVRDTTTNVFEKVPQNGVIPPIFELLRVLSCLEIVRICLWFI